MRTFVSGEPFTVDAGVSGFNPTGDVTFALDGNTVCANVALVGAAASCIVANVSGNQIQSRDSRQRMVAIPTTLLAR